MEQLEQSNEAPSSGIAIPGEVAPQVESREPAGGDDVESRARAMGWVDKDSYRGDPNNWRDADEFVRRGEEELPILRERSRDLSKKVSDFEARLERQEIERKAEIARLERISEIALKRQRDELESRYSYAMEQAVHSGDVERFRQLERDKATAVSQYDQQINETATPRGNEIPEAARAVVAQWQNQNPWFTADPELNAVAQAHHMKLNREKPGLSISENLAEVTKYVRQRYADKFGSTAPAAVEGSGARMSAAPRQKGASSLTADEKRIGEKFVREGLFKDLNEYARDLYSMDA